MIPFLVFFATYLLNIFYITVLYHRGLAHGSVELKSGMKRFTVLTGSWVTGIDPKAWVCMHRMHHEFSDTDRDPHSPVRFGIFGVIQGQLKSYEKTLAGLQRKSSKYADFVKDLEFPVHFLNRKRLWTVPYLLHAFVGFALALGFHSAWLGVAYFAGMMSHPLQGWLVNAFAHWYGYRNFETSDHSRNNYPVAVLVFGEGLQNNHHQNPGSANFAVKWWEPDLGFRLCQIGLALGLFRKLH